MINLTQYWAGRDSKYRGEWAEEIQANGAETVERVNKLLAFAEADGVIRDTVNSGWRPGGVNDVTANAAKTSRHLTARACDVGDPDRALAQWCMKHKDKLALCELWCEDFRWTPTWCHFQTEPPASEKRIYIPSSKPPLAPPLEGQAGIPFTVKT